MIEVLGALFKTKTVRSPSGESSQPSTTPFARAGGLTSTSPAEQRLTAIHNLVERAINLQHGSQVLGALAVRMDMPQLLERIYQLSAPSMSARRR